MTRTSRRNGISLTIDRLPGPSPTNFARRNRASYSESGRPIAVKATLGAAVLVAALLGCNGSVQKPKPPEPGAGKNLPPVALTESDFPFAAHRVLREGGHSSKRSALLAGVVQSQLAHAAQHFARGDADRGTQAVCGALALLRIGEQRQDMFTAPGGDQALVGALKKVSARGDEGRAQALLTLRARLLPADSPQQKELAGHLASLAEWEKATHRGGDMIRLAADKEANVAQVLFEPTETAMKEAVEAVDRWVGRAVKYNVNWQRTNETPPRKEGREVVRALKLGAVAMAALYLRYGRANEALEQLQNSAAKSVVAPVYPFFAKLREAAVDDTAESWRRLSRMYIRNQFDEQQASFGRRRRGPVLGKDLREAAIWGTTLEAYRRDPTSLETAHTLAILLSEYGMPEVTPLVLADALGPNPQAVALSSAMAMLMEVLDNELDTQMASTARRIFHASGAILHLADRDKYRRRVKPSAAKIRQLMAGIEIRAGQAKSARNLMLAALKTEPSVWGFTMLATLEHQVGNEKQALAHAQKALDLPAAKVHVPGSAHRLDAASAHLLRFEIFRDQQAPQKAAAELKSALDIVLKTRQAKRLNPTAAVRVERFLAQILDGYGEHQKAQRAMDRGLELASTHQSLLGSTVLAAVARGLVINDISAARLALHRGIQAGLDSEDLVYGALWLMLLERQLGQDSDGKVERVLHNAVQEKNWTAKLAKWALGMFGDAQLRGAAKTLADRTEANFYVALRARVAGKASGTEQLRRIARSPLIDLMEVRLARELLAPAIRIPMPQGIALP